MYKGLFTKIFFLTILAAFFPPPIAILACPNNGYLFSEDRLGVLQFGINDGLNNTEIFRYASRAQQGMAHIRYKGQDSLFITVRASKSSGSDKGQACRITQFNFRPDGTLDLLPFCFSQVLPIGHGQCFGARVDNGELYFYCQSRYEQDAARRYKGVTRVHWRGAETGPDDVTEIPLLPQDGELSCYGFLTPTVSTDGRYLATLCSVKGGGHACLVWLMVDLKPFAQPVYVFPIANGIAKGQAWQGLCADSRRIYFVHGPVSSLRRHAIAIYDYKGNLVRDFLIQDEKAAFGGEAGIKSWPNGVPWHIELEGIAIRGEDLLVTGVCTVSPAGDVVSWKGKNYVCFTSTDGNQQPNNLKYWLPTTREAVDGDFTLGRPYRSGTEKEGTGRRYLDKYKFLYRITGAARMGAGR